MNDNFTQQRHANYQTPESTVFDLIQRATGKTPIVRTKIVQGWDNEVYNVHTDDDAEWIVRIQQHGTTGFEQEIWAIEACRAAGVPVPEICLIDQIEGPDSGYHDNDSLRTHSVMVQKRVPGRPLLEVQAGLSEQQLANVYRQVGAALGKMHSIQVGGFYKMNADGEWDFPDWESLSQAARRDRAAERPKLIQAGFRSQDVDALLELGEYYQREFACDYAVLCHGDMEPDHLFVDDDLTLTGIIDFGEFHGGTPIHDFAILNMAEPQIDLMWLRAGYDNDALFEARFAERLLLHKLGWLMGYLAYLVDSDNHEERKAVAASLREALNEWKAKAGS